jgi:CRP/FNR family transcriptional regulator, cyclic AMP receptor protein
MQGMGFWNLLSEAEQRALSGLGIRKDYPAKTVLCLEGDPAIHVFILQSGWVKIFSATKDGHEIVLALRGKGDIVGETAGETTGRRTATIQSIDAVQALIVGYDKFGLFLENNPGASRAYRRVVARKFIDADAIRRLREVTNGAQRLAGLLLDLAELHGHGPDNARHVVMPLTQSELASLAGTSRATLTRAYKNWRQRGFVLTGPHHITILDPAGLRKLAGQ